MGDKGDIQLAARHLFRKADRGLADDIKLDIRMRLGKSADDFRHIAVGIIVRRADPERALEPVVVEGRDRLIVQPDDSSRVVEQLFALSGQPVAAAILGKQLFADPFLQPAHLHRNGRLRLEDTIRSLGKTAAIDDGDECMQLVDIERSGHGADP